MPCVLCPLRLGHCRRALEARLLSEPRLAGLRDDQDYADAVRIPIILQIL